MYYMKKVSDFLRKGNIVPLTLIASAFVGFIAVMSMLAVPEVSNPVTSMRLEPLQKILALGETFTVAVAVESTIPVNVFAGELLFNQDTLEVQSIDYNTSIADLWAEKPWYSNGNGTLNFIGGTTKKGGFTGNGKLVTITFKTKIQGAGTLFIKDAQILQHDGLGTNAPLSAPIDALFTVEAKSSSTTSVNLLSEGTKASTYEVVPKLPSTDLNGDGKQNISDVSILLLNIGTGDLHYDLNLDGFVNLDDFNIVLKAQ